MLSCQLNRWSFPVWASLGFREIPEDGPKTLDVPGNHGQSDISLEPVETMIPAQFQTMDPQSVDG